ncbi:SDR family oxidoreductase [Halorubellus litoreus]|uniref:SDR family oxidoreductase n=1 Tax=Halorubellus litoreus TaxID=755308 RepID=A0ABD5VFY0_9EURY
MGRILVTGATGTLGNALLPRLRDAGHAVRAASRTPDAAARTDSTDAEWMELDLVDGTGVERAVADVDVVVHAASAPTGDAEAVDVDGTRRLLDAAETAGVDHVVYPSIVGIEDVPLSYYEHKLAAERVVESGSVPSTIVRATQFHQFLDRLLGPLRWLPVWPLPTDFRMQPVDARVVADELVAHADAAPRGRTDAVCGPDVLDLREIATAYRDAHGYRRPILRLPVPGATATAFRDGHATLPAAASDTTTWREYLAETTDATPDRARRTASAST